MGETYYIAKSVEGMCHGGQIVVTTNVWDLCSSFAQTDLGSPQVVDLGMHIVRKGWDVDDDLVAMGLLQLVPAELAFDYKRSRKQGNSRRPHSVSALWKQNKEVISGRQFPKLRSSLVLLPPFHDAPYRQDHEVTMCFVSLVEDQVKDPKSLTGKFGHANSKSFERRKSKWVSVQR